MNNYNLILDCIDDINDSVVTTESNVITSLMNSYYKQYELFTECEYLGKDPYKIYQEASIMDEVKERSSKDKNKLITFLKFVPRLIITIIKKIKNKLFGKKDKSNSATSTDNSSGKESINANNSSNLFNKETIEKTRKAVSKSKTGKIVLGGVTVVALATGGLLISKAINKKGKKKNNGKSKDVKLEITKDNKIKCNFNIKNIKGLSEKLVRLFKRNTNKINDGKVPDKKDVNEFRECVDKLKNELKGNDDPEAVVEIGDLIINNDVVGILEDNGINEAINNISERVESIGDDQNATVTDQSIEQIINLLPEAMNVLNESVDIITETHELVNNSSKFNDNNSPGQNSGDGKRNAGSDGHTYDDMIKDNCEKLTKFYNNALKHLKDIEDVLSKLPDTDDSGKLRQHFEQMLKKLSRENEKFNTKESLLMLDGTFNMLNDVLGEPIRDSYLDAISREKANKPLPENIYKLLAYLKNIGCVDVYMDDVMEIERVGRLIYLEGPRIPTNIKRQEDCAEINMLPMKLDLEKIGLSHLYTPEHSLDLKLIVKGLGSRFEFSDGGKGMKQSNDKTRKTIAGVKTSKTVSKQQPSPSKSNKIVNNEAVVDGIKNMAQHINGGNYVDEELINVGDDKLKVPVIKPSEISHLSLWLPNKSSIKSVIDAFNKVIKNVILNESKAIDFDKEVLEPLNSVIDKYIHKSIKETDHRSKNIKAHLMHLGYVPLSVNVGDDYNQEIAKYFERAVPETTDDESKKGKIAKIELTPFKWDNDAIPGIEQYFGQRAKSEHILKGVCHYYKK